MNSSALVRYQDTIRQALSDYRGGELAALATEAKLARATVYRLRADPHANPRLDTLQKLESVLNTELA